MLESEVLNGGNNIKVTNSRSYNKSRVNFKKNHFIRQHIIDVRWTLTK